MRRFARPISVRLERGPVFYGWSLGEKWNGWEVVYFEYREARKVASYIEEADGYTIIFDDQSFFIWNEHDTAPTDEEYRWLDDKELWTEIPADFLWVTDAGPAAADHGQKKVWEFSGFVWQEE
jgi:hypothetical protein